MDLFELASKQKFRFNTPRGQVSVEDLWDLPLSNRSGDVSLDAIALGLHRELKSDENVSFVDEVTAKNDTAQAKFDIVRHIIGVKKEARKQAAEAATNRETKQRILGIIAQKQGDALMGASLEELQAMVDKLPS